MDILIVDDDTAIQDLLTDFLEAEGYQTAHASNGLETLTYLREATALPRLILLDLTMAVSCDDLRSSMRRTANNQG